MCAPSALYSRVLPVPAPQHEQQVDQLHVCLFVCLLHLSPCLFDCCFCFCLCIKFKKKTFSESSLFQLLSMNNRLIIDTIASLFIAFALCVWFFVVFYLCNCWITFMFHQVCHLEVPPIGSPSSPGPAELEQAMVTNPLLALCDTGSAVWHRLCQEHFTLRCTTTIGSARHWTFFWKPTPVSEWVIDYHW